MRDKWGISSWVHFLFLHLSFLSKLILPTHARIMILEFYFSKYQPPLWTSKYSVIFLAWIVLNFLWASLYLLPLTSSPLRSNEILCCAIPHPCLGYSFCLLCEKSLYASPFHLHFFYDSIKFYFIRFMFIKSCLFWCSLIIPIQYTVPSNLILIHLFHINLRQLFQQIYKLFKSYITSSIFLIKCVTQ